jgi:hypothetical protein
MNVAVFSAKRYDREFLDAANASVGHRITYFDVPPERETAALEADLFFRDLSSDIIPDDVFQRLISFRTSSSPGIKRFLPGRLSRPSVRPRSRASVNLLQGSR